MALRRVLAAFAVAGALASQPARAQTEGASTGPPARPSVVEFRYGWQGGVTRDAAGKIQFATYPHVIDVTASSPAAQAGLRAGDEIISVNGRDGMHPPLFEDVHAGTRVVLRIRRDDEEREISFVPRALAPSTATH